ncbi:MAG: exostosin family protein [Paracoccaceae bacterium]|nr:exostosin family protein [Paracoccaceae bacterium]
MKVHFRFAPLSVRESERGHVATLEDDVRSGLATPFELADTPEAADLIVYYETVDPKSRHDVAKLLADPVLQRFSEKCVCINYEDTPPGFLPGIYASLPHQRFDPARHRAWGYLIGNPLLLDYFEENRQRSPSLLFSFRGALSHPIRKHVLQLKTSAPHSIVHMNRWYNHTENEQQIYADEILDSQFVLCPRGIGTCSHRLMETMAAGRCAVIISDDWVSPAPMAWEEFSIRVAEKDIPRIPEILAARRDRAADLGRAARRVWEQYFSPETRTQTALSELRDLVEQSQAPRGIDDYRALWTSRAFHDANGWTLLKRGRRAAKDGLRKLKKSIRGRR